MKVLYVIFLLSFSQVFSQKLLPFDSLKLRDTSDFLVDDYLNLYIDKNKNLSLTRYDSLAVQNGRLLFAQPFRVQNVQNPLRISAFSVNSQVLKFFDQNLNETEAVEFPPDLGFVTAVFSEDQQQVWLLDGTFRRLLEYNFREKKAINAYLMPIDYNAVLDFIVFENKLYLLTEKYFSVLSLRGEKLFSAEISQPKRLRRENGNIYVISKESISEFTFPKRYYTVFQGRGGSIVDKNSDGYFELKDGKLYLYGIKKSSNK